MEMELNSVKLEPIENDEEWDDLMNKSSQRSVYLNSSFLRSVHLDKFRYLLIQNENPILGCLLPPTSLGNNPISNGLYQGVFFIEKKSNSYSDDINRINSLSLLAGKIVDTGLSTALSLHHTITDIRGFEWYFFGKKLNVEFSSKTYYTGLIDLKSHADFQSYFRSVRQVRRREVKSFEPKTGIEMRDSNDVDLFMKLYKDMFEEKGISLGREELCRVSSIIRIGIEANIGSLKFLVNGIRCFSGIFILTDRDTDYYQFGATDPKSRGDHGSAYLLASAIESAFSAQRSYFDMVGMNSPGRGDFKASFNARVVPYFEIRIIQR